MRCALVNRETQIIENVIVAEPSDPAPAGYFLAEVPDYVGPGVPWNDGNFVVPKTTPPYPVEKQPPPKEIDGLEML